MSAFYNTRLETLLQGFGTETILDHGRVDEHVDRAHGPLRAPMPASA